MLLGDRVVVVTGASGIAASGARRFVEEGASVFLVAIDEDQCLGLAEEMEQAGGEVGWCGADLTDEPETVSAFSACLERFGRVDGLFAVAGVSGRSFGDGPLDEIPIEGWSRTIEANAVPPFLAARESVRAMRSNPLPPNGTRGSIVLIGSVLSRHPSRLFATHAYAAAKGATASMARAMASHYAPEGIRVNMISPGLVRTPMSERAAADSESIAYAAAKQPLAGGLLEPDDIASAALFLLSDDASRITGQVLDVDGGWGVTEAYR
jgi:NAD(P)-dependent dehydrogenase (short-subunit alcohol dehydrogenase family)